MALSLDGAWNLTVAGNTQQVSVPANIPFVFGESKWSRTFTLNMDNPPAVAYIQFDGIVNSGTVSLNGASLGPIYGFSETRFDVSGALIPNGDNQLVVTLDDRLSADTVPGGDVNAFLPSLGALANTIPIPWANKPGIIRSVNLVFSSQPVITDAYVTQIFSADLSQVNLHVALRISGPLTFSTGLTAAISLNNKIVGSCSAPPQPDGSLSCEVLLQNPSLWSPESPTRYGVAVQLTDLGQVLDNGTDKVGLRKFEARGARFFLNNKPLFLRGICRHDIYGRDGFVASEQTLRQDIVQIKSLGLNYIRSIHYPPTEMLAQLADEYGVLISEELPAWAVLDQDAVLNITAQMLTSLISRDYNRASVVSYLLGSFGVGDPPAIYIDTLASIGKTSDSSRLYSFVRDDSVSSSPGVKANGDFAVKHNLDYLAQNTYWEPSAFTNVSGAMPTKIPFLSTEWTGSEGSDRGPIGFGSTLAFPNSFENTASYSEQY